MLCYHLLQMYYYWLLNLRVTFFFWSKLFYGRLWLNSLTAPKLFKATWVLLSFDRAPYDQKMIWKSAKSGSEDYPHFLCPSWANFNASIKVIKPRIVLKLKNLKKSSFSINIYFLCQKFCEDYKKIVGIDLSLQSVSF